MDISKAYLLKMGNGLGSVSSHCLVDFPKVRLTPREHVLSIRLQVVYNEDGTDCMLIPERKYGYDGTTQQCILGDDVLCGLGSNEQAVLTGVFLLVAQNELGIPIELTLRHLFPITERPHLNIDQLEHPDNTGKLHIVIDQRARALVPANKRMLYISNAERHNYVKYAGLEQHITSARSVPIGGGNNEDEYEVFTEDDVLLKYILTDNTHPYTSNEVSEIHFSDATLNMATTARHYRVLKSYLAQVRTHFKEDIFALIHYTDFSNLTLDLRLSNEDRQRICNLHPPGKLKAAPSLFLTLQFNYTVQTNSHILPRSIKKHY